MHATLHEITERTARTTKTLAEVRIEGLPVGRLSPKMSSDMLPVINYLAAEGVLTGVRAIVKGNVLKAGVVVYTKRSAELSAEWFQQAEKRVQVLKKQFPIQHRNPEPAQTTTITTPPEPAGECSSPQRLLKGQNIPFAALSIEISCSWRSQPDCDADLSALLLCGGKVRSDSDFVFYNHPSSPEGNISHRGKVKNQDGTITDNISVGTSPLPDDISSVAFAVSLDGPPGASLVRLAPLEISIVANSGPAAEFTIDSLSTETAIVTVELYRRGVEWKLRAIGQGYDDGLSGLARDFGVTIDD